MKSKHFLGSAGNISKSLNHFVCNTVLYISSLCTGKLKLKPQFVEVISETIITVKPAPSAKPSMYHVMQFLKEQLPKIVIKVCGIIYSVYREA